VDSVVDQNQEFPLNPAVVQAQIYGYGVRLEDQLGGEVSRQFGLDFAYFVARADQRNQMHLQIRARQEAPPCQGLWIGRTRMCEVRQCSWNLRDYRYLLAGQEVARLQVLDKKGETQATLFCDQPGVATEICHLLVLAKCGEFLEQKGIMRLHACGVVQDDRALLFWGARGAGKSTLALQILQRTEAFLMSDEHGLLDLNAKKVLPFPVRIAADPNLLERLQWPSSGRQQRRSFLDQKSFVDIPENRIATPVVFGSLMILGPRHDRGDLCPSDFMQKFRLSVSIVLGLGLIQMWEFLLRLNNGASLLKIFFNRLRLVQFLWRQKTLVLNQWDSAEANFSFVGNQVLAPPRREVFSQVVFVPET